MDQDLNLGEESDMPESPKEKPGKKSKKAKKETDKKKKKKDKKKDHKKASSETKEKTEPAKMKNKSAEQEEPPLGLHLPEPIILVNTPPSVAHIQMAREMDLPVTVILTSRRIDGLDIEDWIDEKLPSVKHVDYHHLEDPQFLEVKIADLRTEIQKTWLRRQKNSGDDGARSRLPF